MMNVSDNTRLSNTIHRSSIKYVLLDAQQIWPAQCNNARLFTVVHYLCKVFECIYPEMCSETTHLWYTQPYSPTTFKLQHIYTIHTHTSHRNAYRRRVKYILASVEDQSTDDPGREKWISSVWKLRELLMDIWSAITNGLIYRDGYTAVWLLSHSDYGLHVADMKASSLWKLARFLVKWSPGPRVLINIHELKWILRWCFICSTTQFGRPI